ncbi:hypothetical protein B0H19DRAFT_65986 [Mycena capillaripes]|nr:hypothetical protein B0H19DRAFT_65986 [Mycena capillaripes]
MDPITVTTTVVTLAMFIKDLIEIGQSIKHSIEKVSENRRRIRDLTNDVLRTLSDLDNLTRGQEDTFLAPALLSALGNLKGEMLHVCSICEEITPIERPGFRKIGSQIKIWMKRDDIEKKIEHLKAHVNKCYLQFMTFSTARTEQTTARIEHSTVCIEDTSLQAVNTTLRVEQTLIVNNAESQVRLQHLEGMVAQMLLETQFGQNVLTQAVQIISSDPNHESLESQYVSLQTTHLIDAVQKLWLSGNLVLETSLWDDMTSGSVFLESTSMLDILHMILGPIRDLHNSRTIKAESMSTLMLNLGTHLITLQMGSESIGWAQLEVRILRCLAFGGCSAGPLAALARSLGHLSREYQYQLQYEAALEAGQQSLNSWHHLFEMFSEVNNQIGLVSTLVTHAQNLLETGQKTAALSSIEEAVVLCLPIVEQIHKSSSGLASLTEEDEYKAVQSRQALFTLARALSSLDQHLESYKASRDAFQTILQLPLSPYPPSGRDIDSFLDQVCKVAEGGKFTLAMLADCVDLFRNLARMYPQDTSSQFLLILQAYVYFSQADNAQNLGCSSTNLRTFLEPNSERPLPQLKITMCTDLSAHDGILEDAIRVYYTYPSHTTDLLIRNIFVTHFEQAILIFQEVIEKSSFETSTVQWLLYSILTIVPLLSSSNRIVLLQNMANFIEHLNTILTCLGSHWKAFLDFTLVPIFRYLWGAGLLEVALAECEQVIKYLSSHSNADDAGRLWEFQMNQHVILFDLGRLSDAIETIQQMTIPEMGYNQGYFIQIQTRILQRAGRDQEALQLLHRGVANGHQKYWADGGGGAVFDVYHYFLLAEISTAWGHIGQQDKAVENAECAVAGCRKDTSNYNVEEHACVLVDSLTTLSNCLAAVGKHDGALAAAQEAVSIYSQNATHMWRDFRFPRKQEFGANAFYSLSLRVETSGDPDQALINAEKAIKLYRELVGLAPGHLPTLVTGLRNLASMLWKTGRRDEAITTCEEAASIMRKVGVLETYFLPTLAEALEQLGGYFTGKGDVDSASAATAESAEVRSKFVSLPPPPDFLFEKVEMMAESEDEDNEDAEGGWETVSEDSEYHDTFESDAVINVEEVISDAARAMQIPDTSNKIMVATRETLISRVVTIEPVSVLHDGHKATNTGISTKNLFTGILSTPLEVKLNMSMSMHMHSTPMGILWWVLTGTLFAFVCSRLV